MSRVLLTPNALLQLSTRETNVTKARIARMPASQVVMCSLACGIARASVRSQFPPAIHSRWLDAIQDVIAGTQRRSGQAPLPVDDNVIMQWEMVRDHVFAGAGETDEFDALGQDMRLVIATALQHRLIWLEPAEAYHDGLRQLGLDVESL